MDYKVTDTELTSVANAIRTKGGTSGQLTFPSDFVSAIANISGGSSGSTNILSGTSAPTSNQGNNGDIYLQYIDFSSDYTPLEYIESSGTQYINTGKVMKSTAKIKLIEQGLNSSNSLHGVYSNSTTGLQWGCLNSTANIGYGASASTGISYDTNSSHTFLVDPALGKVYFDNNEISKAYSGGNSGAIILFGVNAEDRHAVDKHNARVFLFEYYDDGMLRMRLLPVKRNPDGEYGMLDVVNGTFYTNNGSGSFIPGNVSSSSIGFKIVEAYVKVNGSWQQLIGSDIEDVNTGL